MSSSQSNRLEKDVMQLMKNGHQVKLINNRMQEFYVKFNGPTGSLYEGGVWKIMVEMPDEYPNKGPHLRFINTIYHPNVEEQTGSVCVVVLNQKWCQGFNLVQVFEMFLPELLLCPNPDDPYNGYAAALMLVNNDVYEEKVKEFCIEYANPEDKSVSFEKSDDEADDVIPEVGGQA